MKTSPNPSARAARKPANPEPSAQPARSNDLYEAIYDIVRAIPAGRVTTYGAIAAAIGLKSGARMVGYAMNTSHIQHPPVPAQRVVNRNGMLTGKHHFETPTAMQDALESEGVAVQDDVVADFEKKFWDPAAELGI